MVQTGQGPKGIGNVERPSRALEIPTDDWPVSREYAVQLVSTLAQFGGVQSCRPSTSALFLGWSGYTQQRFFCPVSPTLRQVVSTFFSATKFPRLWFLLPQKSKHTLGIPPQKPSAMFSAQSADLRNRGTIPFADTKLLAGEIQLNTIRRLLKERQ